jgi:hypothetical integral membrane protein (TIGR02206 family)
MMNSFFAADNVRPFALFSTSHLAILAVLALACLGLTAARGRLREERANRVFRRAFSLFIILLAAAYQIWSVAVRDWSVTYSLPLQLCDLALVMSAVMLLNRSSRVFEVTYVWGMGGALQALLTPDLWYAYPHFIFFQFFLAHGSIILACLFMILVEGFGPGPGSLKRVLLATNAYAVLMAAFNYLTGSNYLFLCRKPELPSLLDYLGPWPWYVLSLELVLVFAFYLCYLPFFICHWRRKKAGSY